MSLIDAPLSEALAAAVEANAASLVRVEARAHRGATGVAWSEDGHVVTAHHVVERDEHIHVTLADGTTHEATLVGRDPGTDLALLKVDDVALTPPKWRTLDGLKVGHLALTLARPGRTARAAFGIISARGEAYRTHAGGKIEDYVQTDTVPQPGYSGGLVVDVSGAAIGLNTSGLLRNTNIVIPTATLLRVIGELRSHGHIRRGYLGVGVYPVRLAAAYEQQFGQKMGVILVSVEAGSPADRAGMLMGDVLISIDGKGIGRPGDLSATLEEHVGTTIKARVVRAGAVLELDVAPAHRA